MLNVLDNHLIRIINPTWNNAGKCQDMQDEIMNCALGLAGEAGEVADIIKKTYFHKDKPGYLDELRLELGDVFYYATKLMDLYGFTLEEVLEANRVKLSERYQINDKG